MTATTGFFATEHASALADVRANGAAVTFTHATSTYNPTTGVDVAGTPTTISGYALRVSGSPDTYRARSLIPSTSPTLFFVPSTYGDVPEEGDTVVWAGETLTVKDIDPFEPDGVAIFAYVVVA